MHPRCSLLLVALLVSGLLFWTTPALSEDVGQFTRVVNKVEKLKQGKEPVIKAKVPGGVEVQDMVRTKEESMAVVQFVDDSTMTISPKSKVTIEDYMYDAQSAKNKGKIKIFEGVVETIIPTTDKLQQKDIQIITTTAIAGIRGTKMVSVVRPEGTVFYVLPDRPRVKPDKKSKVKIRLYATECRADSAAKQFIAERLSKKMPLAQILDEAMEAQLDPCDVVRAAVMLGVDLKELVPTFHKVCKADPEYEQLCTPCILLKCTLEALRCLKEVEVTEGQYAIIMKNLAPIVGDIEAEDMETIAKLPLTGPDGIIPYYPPTLDQMNQAKLSQEALQIKSYLARAGVPEGELNTCLDGMGITYAYTPAPGAAAAAPPPPAVTGYGLGGGGGGPVEPPPPPPPPVVPPTPPVSPSL